ncbi:type III-B CRISPR module RAMP protein Cmr4 [Herpetosiphon gulosus]|uniref:CRISPR type III-associated protein domain-containing protein n=1 Tax=Herpetosiphon gulosus TaxID=1973496 RepID=A0ABP9WZH8_9CHLR
MTTKLVFVHALSPLHAGTGQGAGVIDLPIAREKATNLPYLPGSSLKGPLRDSYNGARKDEIFGTASDNATGNAGFVQFSDLRLLCMPVRSLYGTFAWVTSPYILNRLAREIKNLVAENIPPSWIKNPDGDQCLVATKSALKSNLPKSEKHKDIYLEDLDFESQSDQAELVTQWADWLKARIFDDSPDWQTMFVERFCIVNDDVFSFLLNTATEITARIRLNDETKTVADGQLWYEEALPAESILTGLMLIAPPASKTDLGESINAELPRLWQKPIQLGGKATVGRGICRVIVK